MQLDWKTPVGLIAFALLIALTFLFQQLNQTTNPASITQTPLPSEITYTPIPERDYTLEFSEGICSQDSDCEWAGKGCGGGHGKCTDQPEKYEGAITTCDVNPNFPSNKGYSCGCVAQVGKCGWKM